VLALEKRSELAQVGIEESRDRVQVMKEHMANVGAETKYTQQRVAAREREVETEGHLRALSLREAGRLERDVAKLAARREELAARAATAQAAAAEHADKVEKFRARMNWDQEELKQWAVAARQKEEDGEALERYSAQDRAKIRELEHAVGKLTDQVSSTARELQEEVTATKAAQIELDRTAEDFRRLHADRQTLLQQWEDALASMRARDETIREASEEFADRKRARREAAGGLVAQERLLEREKRVNKDIESRVAAAEREVGALREAYGNEAGKEGALTDELRVLQNTIARTRADLDRARQSNAQARREIETKSARLAKAEARHAAALEGYDAKLEQLQRLDGRAARLGALQDAEEHRLQTLRSEVAALKDQIFSRSEVLAALRRKEADLIAEIAGGQSQNANLQGKVRQLDAQLVRQEEVVYRTDFQVQMMERKVARAGGERTDEEKALLNGRIERLTAELEAVNAEHALLTGQVKRAEEDLGRTRRRGAVLAKDDERLGTELAGDNMQITETLRAVRALTRERADRAVQRDVMRLEVKKLEDTLAGKADEVFGLENRKQQTQLSLEERRREIEVHQDALSAEHRMAKEDTHRLTLELRERERRASKLEAKHSVVDSKSRPTGSEEDVTQAAYVIKAAKEREALQREGDELDAKIRVAEKECRQLEQTLAQLNLVNAGHRSSFRPAGSAEGEREKRELRDRLDRAYDRLKVKRGAERAAGSDVAAAEDDLADLREEEARADRTIQAMSREKEEAEETLRDQAAKAERARTRLARLRADIGDPAEAQAIEAADAREAVRLAVQALRTLGEQYPQAGLAGLLEREGLLTTESRPASVRGR